jgi:WD40 repeat protein
MSTALVTAGRGVVDGGGGGAPPPRPRHDDAGHDDDFGSGFNASFGDILRRVEPEVFAAHAKANHRDALDDILGDDVGAHVSEHVDGVPDWMLPTPLSEAEKAAITESFLWMRNYKTRVMLARKSFYEFAHDRHAKHLDAEHFFTLLRMCSLLPPDPATRAAIVKRYTDKDPKLPVPAECLDFKRFFRELLPHAWRGEAGDLDAAPEPGVGDWRATELQRRVGKRRAGQLVQAAHNTVVAKKSFARQLRLAHHHHGQELLNIVGADLRERDIFGQADLQWNMDYQVKMMGVTTRHGVRAIKDKTARLDEMAGRIQRLHWAAKSSQCDMAGDARYARGTKRPCKIDKRGKCSTHNGRQPPLHPKLDPSRTVDDEIDEELAELHKGSTREERYLDCPKCKVPIIPRLLDEHLATCVGPYTGFKGDLEEHMKLGTADLEGAYLVHQRTVAKHADRAATKLELRRCELCGRRVQPERFEKHTAQCEKRAQLKKDMASRDLELEKRKAAVVGIMAPRAPQNLAIAQLEAKNGHKSACLTSSSIKLDWEPPIIDGGTPVYDYEINYSKQTYVLRGKEKVYTFTEMPPYQTTYLCNRRPTAHHGITMSCLEGGVTYANISVRCLNAVGWSPPSNAIPSITLPKISPPGPPLLCTLFPVDPAVAITSSSISVVWSAPMYDGGAPLDHYLLKYLVMEQVPDPRHTGRNAVSIDMDVTKTIKVAYDRHATKQTHVIRNLIGATRYHRIAVTAVNKSKLMGPPSGGVDGIEATTDDPTFLQLLQNELTRTRKHFLPLVDAHPDINGISQRVTVDEYLSMILKQLDEELNRLGLDRPRTGTPGAKARRHAARGAKQAADLESATEEAEAARAKLKEELDGDLLTAAERAAREEELEVELRAKRAEIDEKHKEEVEEEHNLDDMAEALGLGGRDAAAEAAAAAEAEAERKEEEEKRKKFAAGVDSEMFPNYEARLEQFAHKMQRIAEDIQLAEQERIDCIAQQHEIIYHMTISTGRIAALRAESDRVSRFRGANIDSAVIHGQSQRFDKKSLRDQLRLELKKEMDSIGHGKKDLISGRVKREAAQERKKKREEQMQERRAALQEFKTSAGKAKQQAGAVKAWGNRALIHTFGMWVDYIQRRKSSKALVKRIMARLQNAEVAGAMSIWKHKIMGARRTAARDDGFASVGDKMLARVCDQREDVAEQYEDIMTSVAGVKGLLKLSSVTSTQQAKMRRSGRYGATEWAAIERGEAPGTQKTMGFLNLGDGLFRSREFHEAEHYYVRHVEKMRQMRDLPALSSGYGRLGRVCEALQLPSKGIVNFDRARDVAREADDDGLIGAALCGLGRCYHMLAAYQQAIIMFNRALGHYVSMGDKMGEADCYRGLRDAYDLLHEPSHVRRFAAKLRKIANDLEDRTTVGLAKLDQMRKRLVGATAEQGAVIALERVAPLVMRLRAKRDRLIEQIRVQEETHSRLVFENATLFKNVGTIEAELKRATETEAEELDTTIIHGDARSAGMSGAVQRWRVGELRDALREKLAAVADTVEEARTSVGHVGMQIKNWKDDVSELDAELEIETGPLMRRVMGRSRFRFVALNPSNASGSDVMGQATGGIPKVCTVEGTTCFVHDIMSGAAERVMLGDKAGRHIGELKGHSKIISALCFFEERIYTGSADCTIRVWNIGDPITGKENNDYDAYDYGSDGGYSSKGSGGEYSDGEDESMADKALHEGHMMCHMLLEGHEATVTCIAVDVFKIVSGGADNKMRIWHKESGECLKIVHGHHGAIMSLDLDPEVIATGTADGEVCLWDIFGAAESLMSLKVGSEVEVNYAGEGEWFDGMVDFIDTAGEKQLFTIKYDDGDEEDDVPLRNIRLPPTRRDTNPFKKVKRRLRLRGHYEVNEAGIRVQAYKVTVVRYAVSEIVSAGSDGTVLVWETETGDELLRVRHHSDAVLDLAFDAVKIISASRDNTIRITDIATGDNTQTLRGHEGGVLALQFDANNILSASDDGTLRQWHWQASGGDAKEKTHTLDFPTENLAKVARKYQVKVAQLLEWNNIKDVSELYAGMQIIVQKDNSSQVKTKHELEAEAEKERVKLEAEEQATIRAEKEKSVMGKLGKLGGKVKLPGFGGKKKEGENEGEGGGAEAADT